jgi:hypothetical protein
MRKPQSGRSVSRPTFDVGISQARQVCALSYNEAGQRNEEVKANPFIKPVSPSYIIPI